MHLSGDTPETSAPVNSNNVSIKPKFGIKRFTVPVIGGLVLLAYLKSAYIKKLIKKLKK